MTLPPGRFVPSSLLGLAVLLEPQLAGEELLNMLEVSSACLSFHFEQSIRLLWSYSLRAVICII